MGARDVGLLDRRRQAGGSPRRALPLPGRGLALPLTRTLTLTPRRALPLPGRGRRRHLREA